MDSSVVWVDITFSAALAALTIAMGYLGVHVTFHPADSPKKKRLYKIGFWICGGCSLIVVIWQGVRNSTSQQQFANDISAARREAAEARVQAVSAGAETSRMHQDLTLESARRQQAEKDLGIAVQRTELRLSRQMSQTETVLSSNINTYRTDTTNAVSRLVRPGRSFSPSQRRLLVEQLGKHGPREVAITPARGNQECLDFANAIESIFLEAKWRVVRTKLFVFVITDASDLRIAVKGTADRDLTADQMAVARAFKEAGMQMEANVMPEMKDGPVEIYVGLQP
jgi:hypothetical protein